MRKSTAELNSIPNEFHEGGAPEFPPLPDEFNRFAPGWEDDRKDRKRRLRRMLMILAAAGVMLVGGVSAKTEKTAEPAAAEAEQPAAPTPFENPAKPLESIDPTAAPTVQITPAPTPEPTSEPTETPKPTQVPLPGVQVAYYYRSSLVYYATLVISVPERVSAVSFRLTAPDDEEPALAVELTPQQINNGFYELRTGNRDDGFDANSYFAHRPDAELTMELTYTVSGGAGEETIVETIEPSVEDWIDWRFDTEDDIGGIGEMMFGPIFPNCFTVRIFDSANLDQYLTVGDDAETLPNGGVTVSIRIDGREIPAEYGKLYRQPYRYQDGETVYCDYLLVIPIPEDFPQHGTATMTLSRRLTDSGAIIIRTKEIEY